MYKIEYKSSVFKDLKKIDKKACKKLLDKIELDLSRSPGKDKSLAGIFKGLYSYRVGSYRVIYAIASKQKIILVLKIANRKDVYRKK